ncbi:uncharacterized protein LOC135482143 [Liolophura sinensis]|uniref:uncharacterized protein LOC135482143 n=1 Tax=Liolophura sinensis TaxID=3198878 RepID=UPI0031595FE9
MKLLIVLSGLIAVSFAATTTNSHALAEFSAKGISVWSSGGCHEKYNGHCTSFDGLQLVSLSGVLKFKQTSGCAITITGGTEVGHASGSYSHGNGYKLDISDTSCVTNYITGHYRHTGSRSDGAALYADPHGNVFAHESWLHHWDITWYHYTK